MVKSSAGLKLIIASPVQLGGIGSSWVRNHRRNARSCVRPEWITAAVFVAWDRSAMVARNPLK